MTMKVCELLERKQLQHIRWKDGEHTVTTACARQHPDHADESQLPLSLLKASYIVLAKNPGLSKGCRTNTKDLQSLPQSPAFFVL